MSSYEDFKETPKTARELLGNRVSLGDIQFSDTVFQPCHDGQMFDDPNPDSAMHIETAISGIPFTVDATISAKHQATSVLRIYLFHESRLAYKGYVEIQHGAHGYEAELDLGIMPDSAHDAALEPHHEKITEETVAFLLKYLKHAANTLHESIQVSLEWNEDYPLQNSRQSFMKWHRVWKTIFDNFQFVAQQRSTAYANPQSNTWRKTVLPES